MSVQGDLKAALTAIAPTWPVIAPKGTTGKRFTYQTVAGSDTLTFDDGDISAKWVRIQVDAWAGDYGTAQRMAIDARAALYVALDVGEMTTNPDDYEGAEDLHRASFDVYAWE
jgi:hypothetical protein